MCAGAGLVVRVLLSISVSFAESQTSHEWNHWSLLMGRFLFEPSPSWGPAETGVRGLTNAYRLEGIVVLGVLVSPWLERAELTGSRLRLGAGFPSGESGCLCLFLFLVCFFATSNGGDGINFDLVGSDLVGGVWGEETLWPSSEDVSVGWLEGTTFCWRTWVLALWVVGETVWWEECGLEGRLSCTISE